MLKRTIGNYHFVADSSTGLTMRWGKTLQDNPIFAPVPELADISISNHCTKGCSFCYRNSSPNNEFMSVKEYCEVLDAMNHPLYGNVFQVALGGGEPLEHPDFLSIIEETVHRNIVPNFTTNGKCLNSKICEAIKGKVGAVALSAISVDEIQSDKISLLASEGIKTNIHYVLSSQNIEEATSVLNGETNCCFEGVNAIVFLTYKPAGRAKSDFILKKGEHLSAFIKALERKDVKRPKIGFDACFVPTLLCNTKISPELIDTCEGGFFSVYVDHKMNVSPCSFSGSKDCYSLKEHEFYDIWLNKFEKYRHNNKNNCKHSDCPAFNQCRGCCPYYPEITNCYEC